MLHSRMDISQTMSMIISATHSVCRNLILSAFFALIIQISQSLSNYSIYRTHTEEISNIEQGISNTECFDLA